MTDDQILNAAVRAADALDATRVHEQRSGKWHPTTIFDGDAGLLRFGRLVEEAVRSEYVGDVSLFKDRTAQAAAWQCAMMFAQATEWLITVREDGWKHLPLYLKNPLGEQVRTLVYHARDLNVQPKGLGGAELPRLAYALATPGFYGEPVDKCICENGESGR